MSERLANLLGLAATLTILAAPAASEETAWRFDGLDRLYFERLEDPAAAHEGGRAEPALLELLPPILAEGEGMLVEPRVVTDLEGPIHDGLEARDFSLPPQIAPGATVFLRQVIDGTHPRLKEQYWALYSGGRRTDLWFFSTFPERNDSKLLSPFLIRCLIQGQDGGLTLRATGSVYRPHGAGWQHGVDLLFAVEAGEMRYRYAVRRYSFHFGYDLGEGRSFRIGVEDVVEESGRTVLVRRILDGEDMPPKLAESCGIDPEYDAPIGDFERKAEIATCLATSSGSQTLRRDVEIPSIIERAGKREAPK